MQLLRNLVKFLPPEDVEGPVHNWRMSDPELVAKLRDWLGRFTCSVLCYLGSKL